MKNNYENWEDWVTFFFFFNLDDKKNKLLRLDKTPIL